MTSLPDDYMYHGKAVADDLHPGVQVNTAELLKQIQPAHSVLYSEWSLPNHGSLYYNPGCGSALFFFFFGSGSSFSSQCGSGSKSTALAIIQVTGRQEHVHR